MADELENQENEEEEQEIPVDDRLEKRKKKVESRRQQAFLKTAIVLGILVVVCIIAVNLPYRLDLTGNKIYTLSQASKDIVGNLDDKLVVKAYFTDNLPSPYNNTRRYLKEILDDYQGFSKGNLEYEIISPSDESEVGKEAQKYGITAVQVQTYRNDRAEAMNAFMGIVFLYSGKQETIPFIGNVSNLEYEITGAIRRLTLKQQKKIGVLNGPSMPGVDKISKITKAMEKYYSITNVDASKNQPIPSDISLLFVFSPKPPQQMMQMRNAPAPPTVPEYLKFAIDQYVMGGGKVVFLLNRISVQQQQSFEFAQVSPTGLEDMLESYGIKYMDNIIMDKECAFVSVPVQQGQMQFYTQMPFPYYPRITNINSNLPAFSGIGQLYLGLTCSLDTSATSSKGVRVEPLLITSPKTGINESVAVLQTTGKMLPDSMFKVSNILVGAVYTGKYQSFYKSKTIPVDTTSGSQPPPASIKDQSPETRIIAIGNGDFPLDDFRGPDENLAFFASIIDYMTDDVGLSAIRQKDATPKPLKSIEDDTKKIVKYGLLVVPPLIVLLFGVFRWRKRKASNS